MPSMHLLLTAVVCALHWYIGRALQLLSAHLRAQADPYHANKKACEKNHTIFFTHTTSNQTELAPLSKCALESAAIFNPGWDVVLYSFGQKVRIDKSARFRVVQMTYEDLFKGTPLASWYKKGKWKIGHTSNNLSNAARLALLYKYGGAYFDLDMVSVAPLPPDGSCGGMGFQREDQNHPLAINNAALMFPKDSEFLQDIMINFVEEFRGDKWGHNGPGLMTRMWNMKKDSLFALGLDFRVFPLERFCPFSWDARVTRALWEDPVFELPEGRWTAPDTGITSAVHLWNHETQNHTLHQHSAIGNMLTSSCPSAVRSIEMK